MQTFRSNGRVVKRYPIRSGDRLRAGLVAACAFPAPRGSQVLVDEMAEALVREGVDAHLIAPLDPRARERPYRTHAVEPAVPRARAGGVTGLLRPLVDATLTARLAQTVEREGLQVLHAHNYEGLVTSLAVRALRGVPVVYHSHNVFADELPTYAPRALRAAARSFGAWCDRTFPRMADRVVTLSDDVAEHLQSRGVEPHRICVIPPGLDPTPFEEHRATLRKRRAIFTGNLDGYQNLELLLAAWRLVEKNDPSSELVLVTHVQRGGASRRLRRSNWGERVRVQIATSLDQVARELGSAMVGVSPRSSWSGFPIKTLNYMASGTPTIALVASSKGVRPGETGWVVEQETPEALAAALVGALASPRECARRGRAGLQVVREHHCWNDLAPLIADVARAAIADGEQAPARARRVA